MYVTVCLYLTLISYVDIFIRRSHVKMSISHVTLYYYHLFKFKYTCDIPANWKQKLAKIWD